MNKKEVQQRVSQYGKPLALNKFKWDEKTNTFSSGEWYLVLDFNKVDDCTFETSSTCTFDTGSGCTFKTGFSCTFKAGSGCTFKTGFSCTFKAGSGCTFKTGSGCTFKTGSGCTFITSFGCTFNTDEKCVVVRRDVYEVIELKENKIIKLNNYGIPGFKIISPVIEGTITIARPLPQDTTLPSPKDTRGIKYSKKELEERLKDLKEIK